MKVEIVGVRFRPTADVVHLRTLGIPLALKDRVLVRLEKGKDVARVVSLHGEDEPLRTEDAWRILRRLSPEDEEHLTRNRQREQEAFAICESKIKKLRLPMKLLRVEYMFDASRITFYFKAPSKVDFRQLVRQLAAVFKARIELRQVGARDETELLGGIGICGREICCHYWTCRTVKWCRESGTARSKMLGLCNRALCCLKYESTELDSKHQAPRKKPRDRSEDPSGAERLAQPEAGDRDGQPQEVTERPACPGCAADRAEPACAVTEPEHEMPAAGSMAEEPEQGMRNEATSDEG